MRPSSEARNSTIRARSSGWMRPFRHCASSSIFSVSALTQRASWRSVITQPGTTVLTRIRSWPLADTRDRPLERVDVLDIAGDDQWRAAVLALQLLHQLLARLEVDIDESGPAALIEEALHDGGPDPGTAPGDEHALPLKPGM